MISVSYTHLIFDEQAVKCIRFDVRQMFHGFFHEREPFVEREQRLFAIVFRNGHDDAVE